MNPAWIRVIGIYLILLLAAMRFLIVPMQGALKEKKALLSEYQELYRARQSLLEKQSGGKDGMKEDEMEKASRLLYPYDSPISAIQADILKDLMAGAEKNGLTVINFELPEVAVGKDISEATVILRLRGQPSAAIELLSAIEREPRILSVKGFEASKQGDGHVFVFTVSAFRVEKG